MGRMLDFASTRAIHQANFEDDRPSLGGKIATIRPALELGMALLVGRRRLVPRYRDPILDPHRAGGHLGELVELEGVLMTA